MRRSPHRDPAASGAEGPAPESWARRGRAGLARFARRHPRFYAARHVIRALLQLAVAATGIGALIWLLVPELGWPWLDIDWGWLRLLPWRDIGWLWSWVPPLPDWLKTVLHGAKWAVPIVIAVLVAIDEVERRAGRKHPGSPQSHPE
ncbi:hypothetical protein KXS07_16050 [Inquilinus limosus]|uniref:hypothetical protein n=1 Tax=Inquilinus limosus TaxID=171674 RepID=UPI003F158D13